MAVGTFAAVVCVEAVTAGLALDWVAMERVQANDLETWKAAKRTGLADKRLLNVSLGSVSSPQARPLFREAWARCAQNTAVNAMFEGTSAMAELGHAWADSGQEPPGIQLAYMESSGLSPKSSLGIEMQMLVYCLWVMLTVDGYDLTASASASAEPASAPHRQLV